MELLYPNKLRQKNGGLRHFFGMDSLRNPLQINWVVITSRTGSSDSDVEATEGAIRRLIHFPYTIGSRLELLIEFRNRMVALEILTVR